MSFEKNKYQIVINALSQDLINYININFEIFENANYFYKNPTEETPYPFGDPQSPNSFAWYGSIHSEALLQFLKPTVEQITDTQLYESYSYARNYYHGAILEKHIDRPSCEYSATICISKDTDWGIFIENADGVAIEVELYPGDMIVYRGDLLRHWRNQYQGKTHKQVFIHYVNENGKYKNYKFDGRPILGLPSNIKVSV
jgi:hypothetical protein